MHMEACIRQALVLCATRESHLADPENALQALLRTNSLRYGSENRLSQTTCDVVSGVQNVPLRATINEWLERGWSSSFTQLGVGDQLSASSEISHLFHSIGYSRKSCSFYGSSCCWQCQYCCAAAAQQRRKPLAGIVTAGRCQERQ
ncbi:hypothetical protein DL89DRAFT_34398 [Linderina pennispora]|uniref:Trs120/TRAPPC9 TPR region domain-containing protein n=1 Tax=Linderina pennispora TaxID=61395 RepID=A0A1Y1VSR7_9FUNG|nr:uncharacterized protein DL89DRAFT_34398 [Linderina pennispora]ORX64329.1 hypothetical protein DL89DRAFT_34398 [Linderina pennispora]